MMILTPPPHPSPGVIGIMFTSLMFYDAKPRSKKSASIWLTLFDQTSPSDERNEILAMPYWRSHGSDRRQLSGAELQH